MAEDNLSRFRRALEELPGVACWNVNAGAVGSMASLDLGERVLRDKPLPYPNPRLAPESHTHRGQYVLYVEDCPWRLDGPDAVIASWTDSNAPDGPLITGMQGLMGAHIAAVDLISPGLDLIVQFDNDQILRIFPDQVDPDAGDNYSLSVAGGPIFIVAARSTLYIE
jgi:hypothetical protein